MKADKIVPDTSVIIEGLLSEKIEAKELKPKTIIMHEAVLSELEHQANQNRETGYLGLEELKKLRDISKKFKFKIEHKGTRPKEFEIQHAKSGEIDSLIRSLAFTENATLMTADRVQAIVAESKGINTIFIEFETKEKDLQLEKYFDKITMSVHLREGVKPVAKKGKPGDWKFDTIGKKELTQEDVKEMAKDIVEEATKRKDGFIEIQRRGSTIVQLGRYRTVITRPPFSDGWEITSVRPVKTLTLPDYKLTEKMKKRVAVQAEGILIAGAPGNGKSTFAQALAEFYSEQEKIVKTVEAPRDLQLNDNITQYAISHGSSQEIHDILLLSRPDYTIFDEMRNTEDFRLFTDMRLAGVGMLGIVHATNPIDAIQRFIGRIELGVIPQVIDTVIFIKDGKINKVFSIKMEVKVPSGMTEADLARPMVIVNDFETGKLEYEAYTYGEQTVVVPVKEQAKSPLQRLAAKYIEIEFRKIVKEVVIDFASPNRCIVFVPKNAVGDIIGKQGKNIEIIEKKLGISIDVQELSESKMNKKTRESGDRQEIEFDFKMDKKVMSFFVDLRYVNSDVDIVLGEDYLLTAKVSKKGLIKIKKNNKIGKIILKAINDGEDLILLV